MVKVAELTADVKLTGAKEATKQVENLTKSFGFLGSAASGSMKVLEWAANTLHEGINMASSYARQMDVMTFRNKIGAESFQRLEQAFRQHKGDVKDFIAVYDRLQSSQTRWKRRGLESAEGEVFKLLGINPGDYGQDTLKLMDAITQKLINMENIGDRNYIADILGINSEYLRVASKQDYNIWNNVIMSEEDRDKLNKQAQEMASFETLIDGLKTKLGVKWKVDWGLDISEWLNETAQDMVNATDAADGFFDALYKIGAVGINNLGGTGTERNWFGKFLDMFDDGMVLVGDLASGKFDRGEIYADLLQNDTIRNEMRKQKNQTPISNTKIPYNQRANGAYIMNRLMDAGYSQEVAAALVGGFTKESRLNPRAIGDNGTSFGIAQWHNNRARGLPADLPGQTDFLISELQNSFGMTPAVANKMSFEDMAKWALETFENPQNKSAAELRERMGYGIPYLSNSSLDPNTFGVGTNITNNNSFNTTIYADRVDEKFVADESKSSLTKAINDATMSIG